MCCGRFGEYWFILEKMTVHSIPIKSLRGRQPALLLGERHCIKCKANWMRKAKYKPWQVLLNQKWILINTLTKWDTAGRGWDGGLSYDKKAGRDYVRVFCLHYRLHVWKIFFPSGSPRAAASFMKRCPRVHSSVCSRTRRWNQEIQFGRSSNSWID